MKSYRMIVRHVIHMMTKKARGGRDSKKEKDVLHQSLNVPILTVRLSWNEMCIMRGLVYTIIQLLLLLCFLLLLIWLTENRKLDRRLLFCCVGEGEYELGGEEEREGHRAAVKKRKSKEKRKKQERTLNLWWVPVSRLFSSSHSGEMKVSTEIPMTGGSEGKKRGESDWLTQT